MLAATNRRTTNYSDSNGSPFRRAAIAVAVAGIVMSVGCRGSKPFGRFVQVTQDPESDVINVEPPRQRLATARPRAETDVNVTPQNDRSANTDRLSSTERPASAETAASERSSSPRSTPAQDAAKRTVLNPRMKADERTQATESERASENSLASSRTSTAQTPTAQTSAARTPTARTPAARETAQDSDRRSVPAEPSVREALSLNEADHHELMAAFSDYPPEVQREALRRLVAATAKSAQKTSQPGSMESALVRNLDHLPELPAASEAPSDRMPYRLADLDGSRNRRSQSQSQPVAPEPARVSAATDRDVAVTQSASISFSDQPSDQSSGPTHDAQVPMTSRAAVAPPVPASRPSVATVSLARQDDEPTVSQASLTRREVGGPSVLERVTPASAMSDEPMPIAVENLGTEDLYRALVASLSQAPAGETESARASRLIKLRHLMVLSGNVDGAVEQIDGMAEAEQEFLRHQLLGLWTMVDPDGHPTPSRRITTALPQLREATKFAAAATDSLDVRSLSFCTEIESYGQIKPFESTRFSSGQQVILYCEIENFTVNKVDGGFETHLQGSYDVYNEKNEKVISQLLPADRQVSANYLRDYFIAYQMHLPSQLSPGMYRLQLTMEDVGGKKYGQSSIPFQIAK